ncbi:MAG: serine hydrolase, partial [Oscillospiraceae bacterium]
KEMGIDEALVGDFGYYPPLIEKAAQKVAEQMDNEANLIGLTGDRMSYCNDGFGILSYIVGKVSGESSFNQYVLKNILAPLSMDRSCCDFIRPAMDENSAELYYFENGEKLHSKDYHNNAFALNGAGSMKSTLGDMVKYISMWLNGGEGLNGERIISQYGIREILKPRQYYSPDAFYGYGLINRRFHDITTFEHSGGLPGVSSYMCWSYDIDMGIIVLCNTDNVAAGAVADLALCLITGKEIAFTRHNIEEICWSRDFIGKIQGEYPSNDGMNLKISYDDGLKLHYNGGIFDISPIASHKALVRTKFSDRFLEILEDEERGVWAVRFGSSIFPKKHDMGAVYE